MAFALSGARTTPSQAMRNVEQPGPRPRRAPRGSRYRGRSMARDHDGCFNLFWHALDIVWIGVFTIVYLLGSRATCWRWPWASW
jgi:hypothetical protein